MPRCPVTVVQRYRSIIYNLLYASLLMPRCPVTVVQRYRSIIHNLLYASLLMPRCPVTVVQRYRSIIHNLLYASLLMPRCPVTVVQRYRDGVDMQPLVPLVFDNLPSLYPPSFRINDFLYLSVGWCGRDRCAAHNCQRKMKVRIIEREMSNNSL